MVAAAVMNRFHKNTGIWGQARWAEWGMRLVSTHFAKKPLVSTAGTLPKVYVDMTQRTLGLSHRAREMQNRFVTHGARAML